jgi:hypothetical protein
MAPAMPSDRGAYQVRGFDPAGAVLFSYRFDADNVDHVDGGKSFAFSIPSAQAQTSRLAEIEVTGPEGRVSRRSTSAAPARATGSARPAGVRGLDISWAVDQYPMALVRDTQTGEVLSFARTGTVSVPSSTVEVYLSDGVRSSRQTLNVP